MSGPQDHIRGSGDGSADALLHSAGPAKQLAFPDPERGFQMNQAGDRVLIAPSKGQKMSFSDWEPDEIWFRSMVLRAETGEVLSAGFPKFWNYGEGADDDGPNFNDATLLRAMEDEEPVYFTEKMDGSLCIRAVVDGEVWLRTRGQLGETDHTRAMRAVVEGKYPQLLDPEFASGHSLLLEFISPQPEFRIILPYDEEDLVLVGAVEHHEMRLLDVPELAAVAEKHGLRMMDVVELPRESKALMATVSELENREGVVARCDLGRSMVKIKAKEYLKLHRLRFSLTARVVRSICEERDVKTIDDFEDYLREQGADWELVTDSRPLVEAYVTARQQADAEYSPLKAEIEAKLQQYSERRDFAVEYATKLPASHRSVAFLIADGKLGDAESLFREYLLNEKFAELEAAEEPDLEDES